MRARKKPVEIEFWEIPARNSAPYEVPPAWLVTALADGVVTALPEGGVTIKTLEGDHRGNVGDLIIQGVKGELYPCKPDIFAKSYDVL